MKIGYARVSTQEQNTLLQEAALRAAGCKKIVVEKASGAIQRPRLDALIAGLKSGDILVVHKLDRFARSMTHFVRTYDALAARGVGLQSLTENIDTTSPQGRMFMHLLAAFAELEREMIRERCSSGIRAAIARGKRWGNPPAFTPAENAKLAEMWRSGFFQQIQLAEWFGVSVPCIRDAIHKTENRGRWKPRDFP
jgi:DNA invertase Pin-like site-specific DNA recombinase